MPYRKSTRRLTMAAVAISVAALFASMGAAVWAIHDNAHREADKRVVVCEASNAGRAALRDTLIFLRRRTVMHKTPHYREAVQVYTNLIHRIPNQNWQTVR